MPVSNFPKVFAIYDTLFEEYVSGAKGQLVFDNIRGLKLSFSASYSMRGYVCLNVLLNFLIMEKLEKNLVDEYVTFCKNFKEELKNNKPEVREHKFHLEKELLNLVKVGGKHHNLFTKSKYKKLTFNNQTRFVVHSFTNETVVVVSG